MRRDAAVASDVGVSAARRDAVAAGPSDVGGHAAGRGHWLKAVGHARGPLAPDWLERRAELLSRTGFPRRPRMVPGDRLVLYASVWRRVFALAEVTGEPERRDHPRWPWVVTIETLIVGPVLVAAPAGEAMGGAAD